MIAELGHFSLILVLCICIIQSFFSLVGAHLGIRSWIAMSRPAAIGQFVFMALSFGCLVTAFILNDFSVAYVAQQSNIHLPLQYRISGVWGGHEGSMLLWVMMLSTWTLAVTFFSRNLPDDMASRVIGIMGLVSIGFILFILFTSNPFDRILPFPQTEGQDLNPLLQDPGLIIHPPMLYMGYVGFSVAFAFAIAALLSGRLDTAWARWSRPWTTVAWMFLTMGISLGSWWAYYELGWGGWWFWDPVENASFMPWLAGTALIHSLSVTEKRGGFKNWTVLLAITAFSLSILGTFLVRSGVLTSVHAFASDPKRGIFILILLATVIVLSLILFAWRAPKVGMGGNFEMVSRESMLLVNNVMLIVGLGVVMLGTLYPLVIDALAQNGVIGEQNKISVGPPYFNLLFPLVMSPALFFIAVGPISRWKKADVPTLAQKLKWSFGVAVLMGAIIPFVMGEWTFQRSLAFLAAFWIFGGVVVAFMERLKSMKQPNVWEKFKAMPNAFLGMCLAHFAVGIFIIGVTMVKSYEVEKDMRMGVEETVEIGGYTFRFDGVTQVRGPNYTASRGQITVLQKDGDVETVLFPEKRTYLVQTMPMTEAGINTGITRDLYVSLGEPVGNGAWSVRIYYKPFVDWIWVGGFLMAFGGLLAISDRRYRMLSRKRREEEAKQEHGEGATSTLAEGKA